MSNDGNPSGTSARPLASVGACLASPARQDHPEHDDATQHALKDQAPSTNPNLLASSPQKAISRPQPAVDAGKPRSQASNAQDLPDKAVGQRRERLDGVKRTFETIEAITGVIPIFGFGVGIVARVALAVIKIIHIMDSNTELSKDLEIRRARLSELLGRFTKLSGELQREGFLKTITELQSELQAVGKILHEQETLQNVLLSSAQAEALKRCQDMIRVVLEELQPLLSLEKARLWLKDGIKGGWIMARARL